MPMDDLVFFDLNGVIGTPVFDPNSGSYSGYRSADQLLADMDYFGVDYALVSHFRCLHGNPRLGNQLLLEELRQAANPSRLHPCWTLLPGGTSESLSGRSLAEALRDSGVRAVRFNFGAYNLPASAASLEDLLRVLEDGGILTILQFPTLGVPVPQAEDAFVEMLDRLLDGFRGLNIVTGARLRSIYPLMERFENLHLSMEWDPHPNLVEDVCRRFSARRLLFATPYSENARENSGMPMMMITHAGVSAEQKKRIAGANLAALMGGEANQVAAISTVPGRARFASIRAGRPVEYGVVDIHAHAGPWNWEYKPGTETSELIEVMDRTGIERICLNATEAVLGGDHLRANRELSEQIKGHEDRLIGFAVVNPHFQDCGPYIDHCINDLGFRGIKIHPRTHRCALTDAKYEAVWRASGKYRIPILCHTGEGQPYSEPDQFLEIAPRYPNGMFIIGHTGETFAGMQQCIELANEYENIYLEISGWLFMKRGYLEYLVRRVDVRRILFGSDYSWIDLRYALAVVLFSSLQEREKRLILSENGTRMLGGRLPGRRIPTLDGRE